MNQSTAKLLRKVANIYGKKESSLKKMYLGLNEDQRKLARTSFAEVVLKYERDIEVLNAKKAEEEKKVTDDLESKLRIAH